MLFGVKNLVIVIIKVIKDFFMFCGLFLYVGIFVLEKEIFGFFVIFLREVGRLESEG